MDNAICNVKNRKVNDDHVLCKADYLERTLLEVAIKDAEDKE